MAVSSEDTREATAPTRREVGDMPADAGLLILRVVVGLLFAGHGAQKLFGWFGGPGLAGWTDAVRALGYQPARWFALAHGIAEVAGGLLLVLGLLTPLGAAALIGVMINAAASKLANGLWIGSGGFEYEVVLIAVGVVFAVAGAGSLSLDRKLPWARGGAVSVAVALIVGVGAGVAALVLKGG